MSATYDASEDWRDQNLGQESQLASAMTATSLCSYSSSSVRNVPCLAETDIETGPAPAKSESKTRSSLLYMSHRHHRVCRHVRVCVPPSFPQRVGVIASSRTVLSHKKSLYEPSLLVNMRLSSIQFLGAMAAIFYAAPTLCQDPPGRLHAPLPFSGPWWLIRRRQLHPARLPVCCASVE